MKRLFVIFAALSFLMFLGGCQKAKEQASKEPIKVGVILPLTGKHAKFGEIEKKSFQMAVEEINSGQGVNGRKIQLLIEDTQGKPDVGRSAVEKLITQDKVVMIGGGYSSSVTYAAAGVAINKGFPFLVNTGSADKITEPSSFTPSGQRVDNLKKNLKKEKDKAKIAVLKEEIAALEKKSAEESRKLMDRFSIFRLNPPVSEYASGLEGFLAKVVKPKTAVILNENSLFGTKGAKAFEKSCKKLGIKVLMKESYDAGAVDFKPLLAKVKEANPDVVYMISYLMDASLLMRQSMELKMNPKLFAGAAAGFTLPEFAENAGKASEKVVSATLWHESLSIPGARAYYDKFVKRYNKPTEYHGAEAYSAMYVIADVLKRAKSYKPADIKKALSETDMMTVFGPVKFTSYGKKIHQNKLETYVVQWINGKLKMIWPENLAKDKYVYPVNWIKERQ
ncbi:leucine-, isoleucine-, valine-, threonine-, and alanine-binding protein precursor [bacterium BMS3Abin07]|nr:leucine-, isoleucine-, valine-, threonine-, and alanine-binding protein precursor [bacterium BMS3Abin07]GBE33308.1 leucine-, isoleucine-, valine-, threonine-, and alanine-binding protein precursor [bacterium BMS3Bbin05]HDZ87143.1 ABC transporter substrate-binding protein [Nitrospirota bacterium]